MVENGVLGKSPTGLKDGKTRIDQKQPWQSSKRLMWSPTGKPVAPLSFAASLRERRDLVERHPDRSPDHKRSGLKPWLSAVGVKALRLLSCLTYFTHVRTGKNLFILPPAKGIE